MPSSRISKELSISEALAQAQDFWNSGRAQLAEMLCERVLQTWPGQPDALHLLGLVAYACGNLDLAIEYLRKAGQAPSASPMYLSNLAEMLRQKGLPTEAEQVARRALSIDSDIPAAWNNLGIILQETGKLNESRHCLEKLITLQPNNPESHNNLANTYKRLGLLDQALENWLRALELKPGYAEVHSNLSSFYNDLAEYDKAIEHGLKALELKPKLAEAYINLAAVESSRDNHLQALHWLQGVMNFAPVNVTALSAQGLALMHLDRLDEALNAVNTALEYAPEHTEALNAQGLILSARGQVSAAEHAFKAVIVRADITQEKAMINLANLLMQDGRKIEADGMFDEVLTQYPNSASGWFNRSDMVRFKSGDIAIGRMQALLMHPYKLAGRDKMLIHFALGKAYLDINDSEQAFYHLDLGNQLKRKHILFDVQATAEWMERIAHTFTAEFIREFQSHEAHGLSGKAPIFVLGMPRSGTSLVEQILASHPRIRGGGELKAIQRLVDSLSGYPTISPALTSVWTSQLGREYLKTIEPLLDEGAHLVDKMPANFLHAGLIHMILPQARIIHCRRDAVDTCLSIYSKLFSDQQSFAYDQAELGQFYRCYEELMSHWRNVIPATHFIDVDYELVVDNVENESRRMLDFLGLQWDPACLDFYNTKRIVKTASTNQVRQPVYKTSKGRWRQHAAQLEPLLMALGVPIDASVGVIPSESSQA